MVSIIIPAYNAEKYIEQTTASVLAQTWKDWELIIVEDGSTDKTREIVERMTDARIRMVIPEKQGSAAMARNAGLMEAKGRYIAFLDADDIWSRISSLKRWNLCVRRRRVLYLQRMNTLMKMVSARERRRMCRKV